jgi:GGDEF domain-containing protein
MLISFQTLQLMLCYHQAGDECLYQVAQKRKELLPRSATGISSGGEEFAVILPNTS